MASLNNRSFHNVNVLHEQDQEKKTLDTVSEQFYSKTDMTTVLEPINTATTTLNNEMDTVESNLSLKLDKVGGTLTGVLNMDSNKITNVGAPTNNHDGVNKEYVDNGLNTKLNLSGGTLTGDLNFNSNKIINLSNPSNGTDGTNKNYVDIAVNSKLSIGGGTLQGDINMDNHKITNLETPTNNNDGVNKSYVDTQINNLNVNPNTYEFNLASNNNFTIQMPFISSTLSVRAFISFSVIYWTQPIASGHTGISLRKAYYTVELNRSLGLKQPIYYLGQSGEDFITVETQTDNINIYLNNNTSSSTDRGTVVLEILSNSSANFTIGNIVLVDEGDRDTPKLITNKYNVLTNEGFVDNKIYSFKSRGIALTTNEVLKIRIPILGLIEAGARWLPVKVKLSGLNSSSSNTVHFTEAYYNIDVNDAGQNFVPVHYLGKDQTGLIRVDTEITANLATHINFYFRHTVAQNILTSVELDFMETTYMIIDIDNAVTSEIPNGALSLTFPNIPDSAFIVDVAYLDNAILDASQNNVLKTGNNTLTGTTTFNGQTNFGANTVYNNTNILFQTGGNIFMNNLGYILGVQDPVAEDHASNKRYVDSKATYLQHREGVQSNVVCNTTFANRITLNDVILPAGNYIVSANITMRSTEDIDSMGSALISTSFGGSQTISNRDGLRIGTTIKQHNFSFNFRIVVPGSGTANIYPNLWFGKAKWPGNTNPSQNSTVEYSINFLKY